MPQAVEDLILERLGALDTKVDAKLDRILDQLNQGTRRMDSFERDIDDLKNADAKTDLHVDRLEKRLTKVESDVAPVVEVTNRMKTMLYITVAGMAMVALFPTIKPYILK